MSTTRPPCSKAFWRSSRRKGPVRRVRRDDAVGRTAFHLATRLITQCSTVTRSDSAVYRASRPRARERWSPIRRLNSRQTRSGSVTARRAAASPTSHSPSACTHTTVGTAVDCDPRLTIAGEPSSRTTAAAVQVVPRSTPSQYPTDQDGSCLGLSLSFEAVPHDHDHGHDHASLRAGHAVRSFSRWWSTRAFFVAEIVGWASVPLTRLVGRRRAHVHRCRCTRHRARCPDAHVETVDAASHIRPRAR